MVTKDSVEILRLLVDRGVEAIVVGMSAAILQGVPTTTRDLDIVHRRTPENVTRLLTVLSEIDAVARHDPRRIRPNETHLTGPGQILLDSRYGEIDCLGTIDSGRTYEDLIEESVPIELGGGSIRVLGLRALMEVKRRAGRPKDLAAIPYLEATIAEIERKS